MEHPVTSTLPDSPLIQERITHLRSELADLCREAGRPSDSVRIIAVTKTHPVRAMIEALKGGICDLGENKVQEMIPKMEEVRQGSFATPQGRTPVFHLIGHLQTNKARHVVAAGTDLIHSVDSLDLAKELDKRTRAAGRVQQILLQVSISGEETKSGINPAELPGLVEEILRILPGLHIRGLMTMAPLESEPEATRPVFAGLRQVRDDLRSRFYGCERIDPVHLSMGMTNDWRQAVSEGATLIRIGSALFGPRPSASP